MTTVTCQTFCGCFARYAFFRALAADRGKVSPGALPRCAGTDPLQPQPTREDPDHLYSTRTGEVIEHRQRDRFPPLSSAPTSRARGHNATYFGIDTIDRPATTSGTVTHHATPAVAATLATRSSQNSGARNARRKVRDFVVFPHHPQPKPSNLPQHKCTQLIYGTKNSQPPQSSAQRRHCRSRAPGCLPVISASVEICRHQNVIGGAKEAVG